MGIIEDFGFKIYRLRMAQDSCEFLLYDVDKKTYYQYSFKRGKDMLKMLIEKTNNSNLAYFMKTNNYLDKEAKAAEAYSLFNDWILEEIKLIDNISYKPIDELIFEEEGNYYFNIYKKSELLKQDFLDFKGDFPHINKLMMNLVGEDKESYDYFIKWIAWQIQNPLKRLATSIVLQGQQGSGKTLLCNYVLKPIFGTNFLEVSQSDITGDYGEYLMGKQLIVANEVLYNEKKLSSSEKLKNYVSDDFVNIQRKYKDSLYIKNYSQWIFTSNNQVPIRIEKNDRRFTVFKSNKLKAGVAFFQELEKVIEDERKAFLKHLRSVPVILDEVNYPLLNRAKKDIIEASLNSVELFIETVLEAGGIDALNKEYKDKGDYRNNINFMPKNGQYHVKLDSLYTLYSKFCWHSGIKNTFGRNGFTSQLKHLDFETKIIKDEEGKSQRVMVLGGNLEK